jgi:hypothetical protein
MKTRHIILLALLASSLSWAASSEAAGLADKLSGRILLQVEENGEAWYVNPADKMKYFLGRPDDAFLLMQKLGIGISDADIRKIQIADANLVSGNDADNDGISDMIEDSLGTAKDQADTDKDGYADKAEILGGYDPKGTGSLGIDNAFAARQQGRILLQVQKKGEAWYVNPTDKKRYFLGRPKDAFELMRRLGLGIKTDDLWSIPSGSLNINPPINSGQTNVTGPVSIAPKNSAVWQLILSYREAINVTDADFATLNRFFLKNVDEEEIAKNCAIFYPDKSSEECDNLLFQLASARSQINALNENNVFIQEDGQQGIIFHYGEESEFLIYSIKTANDGWKILKVVTNSKFSENTDEDKDGRHTKAEECSDNFYKTSPEECKRSDPNKKDSDGDTWWDGIEIQAETDPGSAESHL